MPIPSLNEEKGIPVPEWNLSPAALKKAQQDFRASAPDRRTVHTRARSEARKTAVSKTHAGATAELNPLVSFKLSDLLLDRKKLELWSKVFLRKRKNQKDMTATEWAAFINAINTLATPGAQTPTFQEFVGIHVQSMDPNNHAAHGWGVHTMAGHSGFNFLAWHREYLAKLEARLRLVNPLVVIPYWDWINDRAIPPQLSAPSDLRAWGITRRRTFTPDSLPTKSDIDLVMGRTNFADFQSALEGPHGWVHNAVGGTMATSSSPADPIFWLHHAMVDKIWADWQRTHTTAASRPTNLNETLQPPPIITRKVSQVLNTSSLGYSY